jgi:hypothetical protein
MRNKRKARICACGRITLSPNCDHHLKPSLAPNWYEELKVHPRTFAAIEKAMEEGAGYATQTQIYDAVVDEACAMEEELKELHRTLGHGAKDTRDADQGHGQQARGGGDQAHERETPAAEAGTQADREPSL